MNNFIATFALCVGFLILTGCTTVEGVAVDNVVYDPGYSNDYVYSVGYYNNRPYWGNHYYFYNTDATWGPNTSYWGTREYNGY